MSTEDVEAPESNISRSALLIIGITAVLGITIAHGMAIFLGLDSLVGSVLTLAVALISIASFVCAAFLHLGIFRRLLFVLALGAMLASGLGSALAPVAHTASVATGEAAVLSSAAGPAGTTDVNFRLPDGEETSVRLDEGVEVPTGTVSAYQRDDLLDGDKRKVWSFTKPTGKALDPTWVDDSSLSFMLDQTRYLITGDKGLNPVIPAPSAPMWAHLAGVAALVLFLAGFVQNLRATKNYRVQIARVRAEDRVLRERKKASTEAWLDEQRAQKEAAAEDKPATSVPTPATSMITVIPGLNRKA